MRMRSTRRIGLVFLATALALVLVAGLSLAGDKSTPVRATHGFLSMGIDVDPSGNTATSVDLTPETCRSVSSGTSFTVDIYVTEVPDLAAWEAYLKFNQSVLRVDGRSIMFQAAQPGSNIIDTSEGTPDTSGLYRVGATDQSVNQAGQGDNGDGVLERITFFPLTNGGSDLSIAPIDLNGDTQLESTHDIGPYMINGAGGDINDISPANGFFDGPISGGSIDVGGLNNDGDGFVDGCDPDDDNDGVLDTTDNCQFVANGVAQAGVAGVGNQTNTDGDSQGDACDTDDDNDSVLDTTDNCRTVANGPAQAGIPGVGNQTDTDNDGQGDACDNDSDNDAVLNATDNCLTIPNGPAQAGLPGVGNQTNSDDIATFPSWGDALGDACDTEDDGDGWTDAEEQPLGTNAQSRCGSAGWPGDLDNNGSMSGGDLNSFLFPLRGTDDGHGLFNKFNHLVSEGASVKRWDLDGTGPAIGGSDINALNPAVLGGTSRPPMFSGTPAFGKTPPGC